MEVCRTLDMIINKLEQVLHVCKIFNWSRKGSIPVTMQRTQNNNLDSVFFLFSLTLPFITDCEYIVGDGSHKASSCGPQ